MARLKAANPDASYKTIIEQDINDDCFPVSDNPNQRTNCIFYTAIQSSPTGLGYVDTTGRFPYRSARHNEYIYCAYNYDANTISTKAIPNRKSDTLHAAWKELHKEFEQAGVAPNNYILDNEFSNDMRAAFEKANISYDLVAPHNHRANAAERAIQTFKNHFISGLSGLDPQFPIKQWDRLLNQATITLNLLRSSRINPKLSAQAFLYGPFDFTSTPLAPPGTRVVAHTKPSQRKSWATRGEDAWYIGPAMDHHRCVRYFFPKTRSERTVDTVTFIPHSIPFPKMDIDTFLRQAATDIVDILKNPPNMSILTLQAGNPTFNAIEQLAELLQRSDLPLKEITNGPSPTNQTSSPLDTIDEQENIQPKNHAAPPRVVSPTVPPRVDTPVAPPRVPPSPSLPPISLPPSHSPTSIKSKSIPTRRIPRITKSVKYVPPTTRSKTMNSPRRYHLICNEGYQFQKHGNTIFSGTTHISTTPQSYFDQFGNRQSLEVLLKGEDTDTWTKALSNELGRLTNGNIHGVTARQCMKFISHL